MSEITPGKPKSSAARVALWRALHVQIDPPPHVLEDEVGLRLLNPDDDWRGRVDMDAQFTRPFRACIVARARFIEDVRAMMLYCPAGAGRPGDTSRPREGDEGGTQQWHAISELLYARRDTCCGPRGGFQ